MDYLSENRNEDDIQGVGHDAVDAVSVDDKSETRNKSRDDFSEKTWKEDLSLIVEGKTLYVAKLVLALVSPVFERMFGGEFQEKKRDEIELPGKKYEDVLEFLRCIYPSIQKHVSTENVWILIPLAEEYQIEFLKEKCERVLLGSITKSTSSYNLFVYVAAASKYRLNELQMKCITLAADKSEKELKDAEKRVLLPGKTKIELQSKIISNLRHKLDISENASRTSFEMVKCLLGVVSKEDKALLEQYNMAEGKTITIQVGTDVLARSGNTSESKKIFLAGNTWSVIVKTSKPVIYEGSSVGFYLKCSPLELAQNMSWVQKVAVVMVLLNQFPKNENWHKMSGFVYQSYRTEQGFDKAMPREVLTTVTNGYIVDGKMTLQVHVLAMPLSF